MCWVRLCWICARGYFSSKACEGLFFLKRKEFFGLEQSDKVLKISEGVFWGDFESGRHILSDGLEVVLAVG